MQAKISVVINTFNAEKHLRRVLEAVKEFDEILVCDMESTDETVAIVEAGVVTGVAEGNATITCIYNGAIATCNVMVIRGSASDVLPLIISS